MPTSPNGIRSAKAAGVIYARVWNAIVRAAAALLLTVAVVTPALAEFACAEDRIMHVLVDETSAAWDEEASVAKDAHGNENRSTGQAGHCASNHGHCTGLPVSGAQSDRAVPTRVSYVATALSTGASSAPDTPERPPSA
jgi:hypothetical protein